jgi:hypothetical protein
MKIKTIKQLLRIIRNNERYAWPGGYPVYICQDNLGIICWDCAQKDREVRLELVENFKSAPPCLEPLYEGEHWCDCCGKQLEVAYPED